MITNLTSLLKINSHEEPEIALNSSNISLSGSEDSPEKMTIVKTKMAVEFNYDMVFEDAYELCLKNQSCESEIPSIV